MSSYFYPMKKTQKIIAVLIVSCLVALIIIQSVYIQKEYSAQKVEFVKDVDRSLEIAIEKAEILKADSILVLLERDAKDTTLVQFKYEHDTIEGSRISIIDPKKKSISMTLFMGKDSNSSEKELLDQVLKTTRNFALDGIKTKNTSKETIIIWDDPLMNQIGAYKDSMPLNLQALQTDFHKELKSRGIDNDFNLITTILDSNTIHERGGAIYSHPLEWKTELRKNAYVAEFPNPFFAILSRSGLIIGSSLIVIILLIFSFILLMRILNKQKKLSEMKDDFMDNISHEMLTPISTLSVAIESLKNYNKSNDKTKTEEYLNIATLELERMSDLFHNVLLTSSFENRNVDLNLAETDLIPLLENLKSYHTARSEKEVRIDITGPKSLYLKTDKDHFTNCINNLLDNAIKYCDKPNIRVKVYLGESPNSVQIEIADNGPGIKESDQPKIFKKFYRANAGNEKGLGIGLYYVKTILVQMNGSIILNNSSKEGSSFLIELNK